MQLICTVLEREAGLSPWDVEVICWNRADRLDATESSIVFFSWIAYS